MYTYTNTHKHLHYPCNWTWIVASMQLYEHMPMLSSQFPVVTVPSNSGDNSYPALEWLKYATNCMFLRYLQVQYCTIPSFVLVSLTSVS